MLTFYYFRVSKEDWSNLSSDTTTIISEIDDLLGSDDHIEPFLTALSTLTPPDLLLKDLVEEMALRADRESQGSYVERITDNLFKRNSCSAVRNSFATKHNKSWSALVEKLSKVKLWKCH